MVIRRATKEDIEGLYALEQDTFSVPWSREAITQEFSNDVATYLVAEEAGKIIGYVGVWCVLDEGQITNVAVHKSYRRCGIGRALITNLIELGKVRQLLSLLLEVRRSNIPAQELYRNCGFQEIGTRKNYYTKPTEDAVLMALDLQGIVVM